MTTNLWTTRRAAIKKVQAEEQRFNRPGQTAEQSFGRGPADGDGGHGRHVQGPRRRFRNDPLRVNNGDGQNQRLPYCTVIQSGTLKAREVKPPRERIGFARSTHGHLQRPWADWSAGLLGKGRPKKGGRENVGGKGVASFPSTMESEVAQRRPGFASNRLSEKVRRVR